jgi:hypothetical protein
VIRIARLVSVVLLVVRTSQLDLALVWSDTTRQIMGLSSRLSLTSLHSSHVSSSSHTSRLHELGLWWSVGLLAITADLRGTVLR